MGDANLSTEVRTGMARFFLEEGLAPGRRIELHGSDAAHISRSLRMRPGEILELVSGGEVFRGQLEAIGEGSVTVLVQGRLSEDSESPLEIHLYQALPKGDKLELIVQKCTELGVSSITPLLTERVIVRLKPQQVASRLSRWQTIAKEAAKQSRRSRIPLVNPPLELGAIPPRAAGTLRLVAWEEGSTPLGKLLPATPPRQVEILIGPEGGLSATEVEQLGRQGFLPVSLGPRILRTETAPLALLAILQFTLGDLGGTNLCRE
jgi:16S rRNA (uracil1498-N3)-methyltransferase